MTELLHFRGFYLDFQMLDPIESSMTGFSRYVGWVLFSPFATWVSNVDLSTYTHNEEPFLSALVWFINLYQHFKNYFLPTFYFIPNSFREKNNQL